MIKAPLKKIRPFLFQLLLLVLLTGVVDMLMFLSSYIPVLNKMDTSLFDWNIEDIVYSSDQFKNNIKKESDIVLVNFRHLDRDSIALLVEKIKSHSPKVIGIDAFFREKKDSAKDNKLKNALQNFNLVTPIDFYDWDELKQVYRKTKISNDFFNTKFTTHGNTQFYSYDPLELLLASDDNNLIRTYAPAIKVKDSVVYCFAFELVRRYDHDLFERYFQQHDLKDLEHIRFLGDSTAFTQLEYKEILDPNFSGSSVRDKLVLLTYLGYVDSDWRNLEGKYTTPLNRRIVARSHPDMYGGIIHANIIAMILSGSRINNLSWITTYILNVMIVLSFMLLLNAIQARQRNRLELYGRISAYTYTLSLIGIGLLLYFKTSLRIDFRLSILYILALPEIYFIYINRALPLIEKIKSRFNKIKEDAPV